MRIFQPTITGSFIMTGSATITGSFNVSQGITGSLLGTASNIAGGTASYLPLWSTGTTLGSSVLYQNGSSIGLGTTSPNTILHISGASAQPLVNIENNTPTGYTNMRFTGTGQKFVIGVGNASETTFGIANDFFIYDDTNGGVRLVVDNTGKVGIGTAAPTTTLEVNGNVKATSFTGSLQGTATTASYVDGTIFTNNNIATSASYAATSSYIPNLGGLLIYRNGSDGVATVSGASTITYSQLIPANTFNTSDLFKLYFRARKTGAGNTFIMRFYVNTTNSLVGATQLGIYTSDTAARVYNQMYRTYAIKNNTNNTEAYPVTTNNFYDEGLSSVVVTSLNINWTQAQYIIFNVACNSPADTAVGSYFMIEKF